MPTVGRIFAGYGAGRFSVGSMGKSGIYNFILHFNAKRQGLSTGSFFSS